MNNVVLVTAAGEQSRWDSSLPKQLITINGETLLDRQKRQLRPYASAHIILANDSLITSIHEDCYLPYDHRNVCETLANTRHLWDGRAILLHGDTVISDETMKRIATDRRPCAFWGNWADILAVSVYEEEANALMFALWSGARDTLTGGPGKLWQAYRAYCGFEMDSHQFEDFGIFIDTMDWSRDFDTVEEYETWLRTEAKLINTWN